MSKRKSPGVTDFVSAVEKVVVHGTGFIFYAGTEPKARKMSERGCVMREA